MSYSHLWPAESPGLKISQNMAKFQFNVSKPTTLICLPYLAHPSKDLDRNQKDSRASLIVKSHLQTCSPGKPSAALSQKPREKFNSSFLLGPTHIRQLKGDLCGSQGRQPVSDSAHHGSLVTTTTAGWKGGKQGFLSSKN